jgi:hypothetical protein
MGGSEEVRKQKMKKTLYTCVNVAPHKSHLSLGEALVVHLDLEGHQ